MKKVIKVTGLIFDSLVFLTIGAIVGMLFFYVYMETSHSLLRDVKVPNLRGASILEALKSLKSLGLVPVVKDKSCEKVIGTYPSAGSEVRRGRSVEIYCLETSMDELANMLSGIPLKYAVETLKNLGLKYDISKIPYPGSDGKVLGAIYSKGKMFLLVDEGEPKRFFIVGDYRGKLLKDTERILKSERIPFRVEGSGEKVVDQFPQPGSIWNSVVLIAE